MSICSFQLKEEELHKAIVLLLANKQDQPNSLESIAVSENVQQLREQRRKAYVQVMPCCAQLGQMDPGICKVLQWLWAALLEMVHA